MTPLGDRVTTLLANAKKEVLIVAPFMRTIPLRRLLDVINSESRVRIVCRWRISDLVVGASDLGILDAAQEHNAELYMRDDLHAKLFAADDSCLVGSANVTATALGWRDPANLELLTPVSRLTPEVVDFEAHLFEGAVSVSKEHESQLAALLDGLAEKDALALSVSELSTFGSSFLAPNWLPQTMNPEELYAVYGGNTRSISKASLKVMRQELVALGVPVGLSETQFRSWVGLSISKTLVVSYVTAYIDIHGYLTEPVLFDVLSRIGVNTRVYRPRAVLQVLERWLTHFLPSRYETAQDSIKLIKVTRL